jgi:hypothetical protein
VQAAGGWQYWLPAQKAREATSEPITQAKSVGVLDIELEAVSKQTSPGTQSALSVALCASCVPGLGADASGRQYGTHVRPENAASSLQVSPAAQTERACAEPHGVPSVSSDATQKPP